MEGGKIGKEEREKEKTFSALFTATCSSYGFPFLFLSSGKAKRGQTERGKKDEGAFDEAQRHSRMTDVYRCMYLYRWLCGAEKTHTHTHPLAHHMYTSSGGNTKQRVTQRALADGRENASCPSVHAKKEKKKGGRKRKRRGKTKGAERKREREGGERRESETIRVSSLFPSFAGWCLLPRTSLSLCVSLSSLSLPFLSSLSLFPPLSCCGSECVCLDLY